MRALITIAAGLAALILASPAFAGDAEKFRADCAAKGGEVLTTTQVVDRGLQGHFRDFRPRVRGNHCYIPPRDDRARIAALLKSDSGFRAWHDACAAAGREVYTTAEFDAKFPHLAKKRDNAPFHCYRPARASAVRSLIGG